MPISHVIKAHLNFLESIYNGDILLTNSFLRRAIPTQTVKASRNVQCSLSSHYHQDSGSGKVTEQGGWSQTSLATAISPIPKVV